MTIRGTALWSTVVMTCFCAMLMAGCESDENQEEDSGSESSATEEGDEASTEEGDEEPTEEGGEEPAEEGGEEASDEGGEEPTEEGGEEASDEGGEEPTEEGGEEASDEGGEVVIEEEGGEEASDEGGEEPTEEGGEEPTEEGGEEPTEEGGESTASDEGIRIELTWDTPGDADQTDQGPEAGTDLDLHFAHPNAAALDIDEDGTPDKWFDQPYDCFWFNAAPDWGPLGAEGDPSVELDDTDGAGPEIIYLDQPEGGLSYDVGVHCWSDHGYGGSVATVKVYVKGNVIYEASSPEMVSLDLWEVGSVAWPSGEFTPSDAFHEDYANPFFFP